MVFNLYVSGAIFGLGRVFKLFGPCGAPRRADFSARGCPQGAKLCFAQPIILAYGPGTYASARISRHSVAAWLYAHCCKVNVDYCARPPPGPHKFRKSPRSIRIRRVIEI